jgi:hypothetical protein
MRTLIALALLASTAAHAGQTFEDRAAWETAASGVSTTYTFVGLEHNQPKTRMALTTPRTDSELTATGAFTLLGQ